MLGTYASFLLVLCGSAAVGQAVFAIAGRRAWSWLAPAVGLAALFAIAWGTVRLPGEGTAALVALGVAAIGSLGYLRGRVSGLGEALGIAAAVALAAAALASLPFVVEGRFGILGTGLNPDMSQHLFAADRLAGADTERLILEGYPLGPHAVVVALAELGPSTVQAFGGLTLAIAAIASVAPLALLGDRLSVPRRIIGALAVGFAYLVASSLVQGAFKETAQALFVLAFAIGLFELAHEWGRGSALRSLAAVPLAVIAVGSVYVYSFPGLAWLAGTLGVWVLIELGLAARRNGFAAATRLARAAAPTAAVALGVLAVAIAPEAGRMADFAEFETFDPEGPGLGNLFDRLSPLEALGVWPSGDFRVEPGGGAAPAAVFYLGAALAAVALGYGLARCRRRAEWALPAALAAAGALWIYSLVGGTPYQESKALVLIAPLAALIAARALLDDAPSLTEARRILRRRSIAYLFPGRARVAKLKLAVGALTIAFLAAAAGSSLLALANGPVGPSGYSPALAELRDELGEGSTVVLAPRELLDEQHGRDYLVWELRGNRVCVDSEAVDLRQGASFSTLSVALQDGAVVPEGRAALRGQNDPGPCPYIPDGVRADPAGDG